MGMGRTGIYGTKGNQIMPRKLSLKAYADNSITTAAIANDAVTAAKIPSGAVVADIADGSITTAKLANNAVTGGKINPDSVQLGRRNKIHNGDARVAQRGPSSAQTAATVLDRWVVDTYNQDQLALQISQSTDTPDGMGFSHSHLINVNAAESAVASDEYCRYYQSIEARDMLDACYGSSSPKKLQLSFWVKATGTNVTGTYGVTFWIQDANKYQTASYTINSANTWEKKTIEVATSGHATINNDNGIGLRLNFFLMAGSGYTSGTYANQWGTAAGSPGNTHFAGGHQLNTFTSTVNNKWYMTGCQLEVADTVSDFEHRTFEEELRKCQRFYFHTYGAGHDSYTYGWSFNQSYNGMIYFIGTGNYGMAPLNAVFPVEMRAGPTVTTRGNGGTASRITYWNGSEETHGTINRNERQVTGMSKDAGTNTEDFYSCGMEFSAEI